MNVSSEDDVVLLIHRCINRYSESYETPFTRPFTQLSHIIFANYRTDVGRRKQLKKKNESVNNLLAHSPFSPPLVAQNKRHYGQTDRTNDVKDRNAFVHSRWESGLQQDSSNLSLPKTFINTINHISYGLILAVRYDSVRLLAQMRLS